MWLYIDFRCSYEFFALEDDGVWKDTTSYDKTVASILVFASCFLNQNFDFYEEVLTVLKVAA